MMSEIDKLVFEKYPKTEKEKTCWQEKLRLNELRRQYKIRLEQQKNDNETKS